MMKSVIALLAALLMVGCATVPKPVVSPQPEAQERAHREIYTLNNEGGVITLTNEPCDKQAPPGVKWFSVTSETRNPEFEGGLINGCWLFALDYPSIIIHWETGHVAAIVNPNHLSARRPESFAKQRPDVKGEF